MNSTNLFKLGLLLIGSIFIFGPAIVYASEGDEWPYAQFDCSRETQQLSISESIAASRADIPNGSNILDLNAMYRLNPIGKDDGVLTVIKEYHAICILKDASYRIVIVPYKYNNRIQGVCGAGAPSARVTVYRGKKPLLNGIVFNNTCFLDGDLNKSISKITIIPSQHSAIFDIKIDDKQLTQKISFDDAKEITRANIFYH